jgi:uncharacterized protein YjiS (DUF1127 family)
MVAETLRASARRDLRGRCLGFALLARRAVLTVEEWFERRRQRRVLLELSEAMLKDIGLSRGDALREASKPFWRL